MNEEDFIAWNRSMRERVISYLEGKGILKDWVADDDLWEDG